MTTPTPKPIKFSKKVEQRLYSLSTVHNAYRAPGRKVTLPMLRTVYRRGAAEAAQTASTTSRDEFAMARVHAFLELLDKGKPGNPNYTYDNDVLPSAHPKSTRGEAAMLRSDLLQVALQSADKYCSPEHAIFAMAEYSDLSYDIIPALRGRCRLDRPIAAVRRGHHRVLAGRKSSLRGAVRRVVLDAGCAD